MHTLITNRLISVNAKPTLLCIISFYFDIIESNGIFFIVIKRYSISLLLSLYPLRDHCTSFSLRFFTGVWLTASLLRSPTFFSLFLLILTMQYFGWPQFVLRFLILFPILWGRFKVHQLQLVSLLLSCSTTFF